MNFQLLTQYSAWWILLCLFIGLSYAWILYRKHPVQEDQNPWFKRILFALRLTAVSILAFLLLSPVIRSLTRETEKPLLVFAQDNSSSILLGGDSAYYKTDYAKSVRSILDRLKEKYDVSLLSWGDLVKEDLDATYQDKQTDFSSLYDEMNIRLGNRNVGAVVIASDGLYNRGSNPLYLDGPKVPIYTVAMGDTIIRKDLLISNLNYNRVVYLGNSFPLEINIDARRSNGASATLKVKQDSLVLFSRDFKVSGNRFSQMIPVVIDANSKGMKHYKVELSFLPGEITYSNNVRDVYIEVKESKQKILLVANAPHPDLAALKQAVESSGNYSIKIEMANDRKATIREYNLMILHNLPSSQNNSQNLVQDAIKEGLPVLFILGAQTNTGQFNSLGTMLSIQSALDKTSPVQAAFNSGFSLFTLSEEARNNIPQFPPLLAPFGKYTYSTDHYDLLTQQVGAVTTRDPLLVFSGSAETKIGILCGEGMWRWRLDDYMRNGNFNVFNEIIGKTVQNLIVKETKNRFRLVAKTGYAENEPVTFDAEVYNNSYELINDPDVKLTITNRANKNFPYLFSKTDRAYNLNAGYLPAGDYRYKATVNAGDQVFSSEGSFSVSVLHAEQSETVADHQLLNTLSHQTGGKMYYPKELEILAKELLERDDLKTVSYSHFKMKDLVNMKIVFFILLALLSLEWFLRKRSGSY
ncbi:MAG: hypothetical protein KA444_05350 [Bacteroidia bacterium]|nr:hypothetical protein [Bacteroidia bacterium]